MMQENVLAAEMLSAMGGKVSPARLKAFTALARAIIRHIQLNMVVVSSGPDPQSGVVVSTSTMVT